MTFGQASASTQILGSATAAPCEMYSGCNMGPPHTWCNDRRYCSMGKFMGSKGRCCQCGQLREKLLTSGFGHENPHCNAILNWKSQEHTF
jgi:hypothetical protein